MRLTVQGMEFAVLPAAPRREGLRTFVLVHGIGVSHRYFARLSAQLVGEANVVCIDLPGFGGLPKPGRDISVAEMATALAEVLDREGVSDAVLVGHSMGAQWVVELAVQRPDLAAEVVIIGPVTDDHHRSVVAQAVALTLDCLREAPTANLIVIGDYLRCGPRWYLTHLRHMLTYPIEQRVAQLRAPLLVLRGGRDPVAGIDWCRRLRDIAAHGRLIVVPGGPHVVQHSAPRAVASALLHTADETIAPPAERHR